MALTELIFGTPVRVQVGHQYPYNLLGLMQFDCSVSEIHMGETEITDHPVEATLESAGAVASDHVRVLPESVEINGIVTDTPITYLASLSAASPISPFTPYPGQKRVDAAYALLRDLKDSGAKIGVVTSLRTYENMVIKSLRISRDEKTGNVLDCTILLREVSTVTSLSLEGPMPTNVANQKATEKAKVAKEEASSKQQAASQRSFAAGVLGI